MHHTSKLALVFLLLLSAASCRERVLRGTGPLKTEARELGSGTFDKIRIEAPLDAEITVGEGSPSLRFRGHANVLRYLRSEVRNNTLHIFTDDQTDLDLDDKIAARISLPALSGLDISGAAEAHVKGPVQAGSFELDLSGAGEIEIEDLTASSFDADLSGAASLMLHRGAIGDGRYDLSGSGDIRAFGVSHRNARLDLSGAAQAELTVTENLDAEISGAGTVRYKGHPKVSQDVSGAGSVQDAN